MNSGGGVSRSGRKWTSVGHVEGLVTDAGSYKAGDVQAAPGTVTHVILSTRLAS